MTADEIRDALAVLVAPGDVFEVRMFGHDGSTWSGYFADPALCADQVEKHDAAGDKDGIYVTLNPVDPALHAKRHDRLERLPPRASATGDPAIARRRWLLVDIDVSHPEGVSGISSTDAEKAHAVALADRIAVALGGEGWPAPVVADSGNGAHLLFCVDLPNNPDATGLIRRCLQALAARYDEAGATVDTTVFNASRISKLYGTVVRKGSHTTDRPHRRAALVAVPDALEPVPDALLQALADEAREAGTMTASGAAVPARAATADTAAGTGIDLRAWLEQYGEALAEKGFAVREKPASQHRVFGEFERCPFSTDQAHADGARIGQWDNGTIYATCKHRSCQDATAKGKGWRAIRALVEPPKKARARKGDGDEPPKKTLPYFELDGRLYLDVGDESGRYWFAHLDEAGALAFSATVTGADGIAIVPRQLDRHPDSGEVVPIVGIPSREAMADALGLEPATLYTGIDRHLSRYVDAPPRDRELFVYYILYSWLYRKCTTAPYLRFLADTGKGKSRFLRTVSDLCFYPVAAGGSSTTSGIMRYHEKWPGTLRIDESDLQGGADNPMIKYLNLGFEAGQFYIMTNKNDPARQEYFDPFGPKVIAMREPFGDVATEGRVLSFSPRETQRSDIPVELDAPYFEAVRMLRAHIARFMLERWPCVDGARMIDLSGVEVEPRLKQMIRPLSLVLQLFPDGEARILAYLKERQIEIRRERAASFDGLCFNLAVKLADGAEDVRNDPKFAKYYRRDGALQAVEPRMVAALLGTKTQAVSGALRRIGFKTTDTKITFEDVADADEGEQGAIQKKTRTVLKATVPDEKTWREMVSRYYFEEPADPGEGQATLEADENGQPELECPHVLQGHHFTTLKACTQAGGNGGTGGTDHGDGATSTASTANAALPGTRPAPNTNPVIMSVDADTIESARPVPDGDEVPA